LVKHSSASFKPRVCDIAPTDRQGIGEDPGKICENIIGKEVILGRDRIAAVQSFEWQGGKQANHVQMAGVVRDQDEVFLRQEDLPVYDLETVPVLEQPAEKAMQVGPQEIGERVVLDLFYYGPELGR
jgi:hypothetical protein